MKSELESLNLVLHDELNLVHLSWSRLAEAVLSDDLSHTVAVDWPTSVESLEPLDELTVMTGGFDGGECRLVDLTELVERRCVAYVRIKRGNFYALIAGDERRAVVDAESLLLRRFPRAAATEAHEVPFRFWANNYWRSRTIAVRPWVDIAGNYPSGVAAELSRLLGDAFVPGDGGRLLLWHGPPGVGKTHALRALSWEWRDWCSLDYVTDPEVFFRSSEYMLDALLDHQDEERWRLLVLEDTGELLTADAKERTGQGLSRFLNVVDGVLGQGLRLLVLVTTNEELRSLHPAVARPGRSAAVVEFRRFTTSEASAWLEDRGVTSPAVPPTTLAELFALAAGRSDVKPKVPTGFAAESPA